MEQDPAPQLSMAEIFAPAATQEPAAPVETPAPASAEPSAEPAVEDTPAPASAEPAAAQPPATPSPQWEETLAHNRRLQQENEELRRRSQDALDKQTELLQRMTEHLTKKQVSPEEAEAELRAIYEAINKDPQGFVRKESSAQVQEALKAAGLETLAKDLKDLQGQMKQLDLVRLDQEQAAVLRGLAENGYPEMVDPEFQKTLLTQANVDAVLKRHYPGFDRKDEAAKRKLVTDPMFYERLAYLVKTQALATPAQPAAAVAAPGQPASSPASTSTAKEVERLKKTAAHAATQAGGQAGAPVKATTPLTPQQQLKKAWDEAGGQGSMRSILTGK